MVEKIVLAYSGGLDTSVAIHWLMEKYDAEIITMTIDLGGNTSLEEARKRAIDTGAKKAIVHDATAEFIENFIWPALQAGALYEGIYHWLQKYSSKDILIKTISTVEQVDNTRLNEDNLGKADFIICIDEDINKSY